MNKTFPKPTILEKIGTNSCAIESSAGTGKTYLLEHIALDLIIQGVPLNKILMVTFTTKATIELKARIRTRLEKIILEAEDQKIPKIYTTNNPVWTIDKVTYLLLKNALNNLDKINISTIHSFCQQIIIDSAFESGQLFKQTVVHGNHAFNQIFKKYIHTQLAQTESDQLFLTKALEATGGVDGLSHLLWAAMKEYRNLDLPNMTTLAKNLEKFPIEVAKNYIEEIQNYQSSSTEATKRLHGPLLKMLKASNIGGGSYNSIGTKLKKLLCGIKAFNNSGMPGLFWSEITPLELRYLQERLAKYATISSVSNLKENEAYLLASACSWLASNAYDFKAVIAATILPTLIKDLKNFKHEEGLIDFDDMILLVSQLINSHQGASLIQRLQDRFQIALIDEFQDTDNLQWEIFKKIFLCSEKHRLILVGDPKQAIYGFRGGDLPTYIAAINDVQAITGKKAEELVTNFRSSPEIIAAQCKIFQGHADCPFFTGKNSTLFKPPICGRPELKLQDNHGKDIVPIHIIEVSKKNALSTRKLLANGIALAVKETLCSYKFEGRLIKPEHVMVLTNSAKEGLEMAKALKAIGVANTLFRQNGLFTTAEANAILDLLLAIDQPTNVAKRAKALLGPFFSFSFEEVEQCHNLPENHPILMHLFNLQNLALSGQYGEFFTRIISDSGITQRLLFLFKDERSITNIQHLLELLQKEALTSYHTPLDLAIKVNKWIQGLEQPCMEDGDTQRIEKPTNAVRILTIHKAKGLEAPIVAVYGGFFINGRRSQIHRYHDSQGHRRVRIGSLNFAPTEIQRLVNAEQQENYQRLLYVALTRAKAQLILPKIICNVDDHKDANNRITKTTVNCSGAYQCINQQLIALPNNLTTYFTITNCDNQKVPEKTIETDIIPPEHCYNSLPKLTLPDFSYLTKIGSPICEFSHAYVHSNPCQLSHQHNNNWQIESDCNQKTIHPILDYKTRKNSPKLEVFVRSILQLVPLPLNDYAEQSTANWLNAPIVASLFNAKIPLALHKAVATWVHEILTCELRMPKRDVVTLSKLNHLIRNLDFTTIYSVSKNLISGSVDMIFQWHGKTYILDWKIDQLGHYHYAKLKIITEKYYLLQAKIHIIATCRFLDITSEKVFQERFGGLIYAFIGGLPNEGIWTLSPSWNEVKKWELELENTPIDNLIIPYSHIDITRH